MVLKKGAIKLTAFWFPFDGHAGLGFQYAPKAAMPFRLLIDSKSFPRRVDQLSPAGVARRRLTTNKQIYLTNNTTTYKEKKEANKNTHTHTHKKKNTVQLRVHFLTTTNTQIC